MTVDLAGVCKGPGPCDVTSFGTGKNWVSKVQGLPLFIRAIAHALVRDHGMDESRAISTAVATVKRWAAGGGGVTAETRARAVKAVAEWEAKKAASHALTAAPTRTLDLATAAPTHVYHWRHGWIPITPHAALQKAHGSHAGAARLLGANGQHEDAQRMLAHGLAAAKVGSPMRTRYRTTLASHMQRHGTLIGANPSARPTITGVHIEHTGDGTLVHGTSRGDGTAEILKRQGFRWSSNLSAWYLPRTQQYSTRSMKVDAAERELRAAGHDVTATREAARTTTAAEREAMQQARSTVRAEHLDQRARRLNNEADSRHDAARQIMDRIPMGQPILIGHHSERGHRADMKRIDSHISKSLEARREADSAERRAEAARQNARPDNPLARQRRIDRTEAEIRRIDKTLAQHEIAVKKPDAAARFGVHPLSADRLAQLRATRADLADQVAHDKAQIDASGHKAVSAADIKAGDVIHYRGRTHVVKKVNKTTVSVPTGYSWDDKVPINQITKVVKQTNLTAAPTATVDLALSPAQRASIDKEAAAIRERAKTATFPHKFVAADWTHPNGHPRCKNCGQEERSGGVCTKPTSPTTAGPSTSIPMTAAPAGRVVDLVGPHGYSHGWVRIDASTPTAVERASRAVATDGHTLLHGPGMVAAAQRVAERVRAMGHGTRVRRIHLAGKTHLHVARTTR